MAIAEREMVDRRTGELAPAQESIPAVNFSPRTWPQLLEFAGTIAKSELVPTQFRNKPADIAVAVQWGNEVGLAPLQSLQSIAVINGRPTLWGDAVLGLVRASGKLSYFVEKIEGEGDAMQAVCHVQRVGQPMHTQTFSVADAKKAGLWGKQGPWTQYAQRMLRMRARGFALRDQFPDVLRGMITTEEAQDYPAQDYPAQDVPAPQPVALAPAPIPTAVPKALATSYLCCGCGKTITRPQAEATEQQFGQHYCAPCARKAPAPSLGLALSEAQAAGVDDDPFPEEVSGSCE